MKVLITGNMGYVGCVLVKHLKNKYKDIEIIGHDTAFFAHCLTDADSLPEAKIARQYFGDLRELPQEILTGVDAVVHLAAISNDPIGNEFAEITKDINHKATVRLAELAVKSGVKNFVYASSCSIYGAAEGGPRKESDALNPLTAYAVSKVSSEEGLASLDAGNMVITALRFSTACGMSERLRLDLVLNDFVTAALLTNEITVLSDGSPWRPLINVKDMARAIEWASTRTIDNGGQVLRVNVGSDMWNYQVKDLANAVAANIPGTVVKINTEAPPDKRSYQVDFSLFKSLAKDYQPQVTLEQTINELKEGISNIHFENDTFRNSQFIRFNVLKNLIAKHKINKELVWIG